MVNKVKKGINQHWQPIQWYLFFCERSHFFNKNKIPLNPLSVLVYPLFHLFLSYISIYIYPNFHYRQYDRRSNCKDKYNLTEFWVFLLFACLTKVKEHCQSYYYQQLEVTGAFMPFPKWLARNKRQKASTRIWNRMADSISLEHKWYAYWVS